MSAKSLERPGLQSALSMLERGKANNLLVVKLDRLTRSLLDVDTLIRGYFTKERFHLLSVSESLDTRTAMGRFVLYILGLIAQWEREAIGERTREAMAHLKHLGVPLGAAPYGFLYSNERDAEGRKRIVEAPEEQEVIARILKMFDAGTSATQIAKRLSEEAIAELLGRLSAVDAVDERTRAHQLRAEGLTLREIGRRLLASTRPSTRSSSAASPSRFCIPKRAAALIPSTASSMRPAPPTSSATPVWCRLPTSAIFPMVLAIWSWRTSAAIRCPRGWSRAAVRIGSPAQSLPTANDRPPADACDSCSSYHDTGLSCASFTHADRENAAIQEVVVLDHRGRGGGGGGGGDRDRGLGPRAGSHGCDAVPTVCAMSQYGGTMRAKLSREGRAAPAGSQGTVLLDAACLDSGDCKLATGHLEEPVPGNLRRFVERTLELIPARKCIFADATEFPVGVLPSSVAVGYFNGGMMLDLAVANSDSSSNNVSVLLGNGLGSFGIAPPVSVNSPYSVAVEDGSRDSFFSSSLLNRDGVRPAFWGVGQRTGVWFLVPASGASGRASLAGWVVASPPVHYLRGAWDTSASASIRRRAFLLCE